MKKLLALILSVAMIFTMVTGVMAYSDVEENIYVSEAVTVLSNLDILNGYEDGTFKPEATITRAEMAKIVCEALGYYGISSDKTPFDDVDSNHWAADYINAAANLGIICGYGDGRFGPEDTVTYEQAIKMIVYALGYEPMAMSKGGWPAGYVSVAVQIGLTEGVNSSTRGDIAVLVYNALTTPVMEQTAYGSEIRYEILDGAGNKEYKTILTKRDIYIATAVIGEVINKDYVGIDIITEDFSKYKPIKILIGDTNIADYTYQEVEVYMEYNSNTKEYTALSVIPTEQTETFTLISDDVKSVDIENNKIIYYIDSLNGSKTKSLAIDKNATVEYNKNKITTNEKLATEVINSKITDENGDRIEDIKITLIDNNGDLSYDVVTMTEYTSTIVESVDADRDKISFDDNTIIFDYDDKDVTYILTDDNGNELTLDDFSEDDVIAYIIEDEEEYIEIIKLSESAITGKIEAVYNNDKVVVINGEKYKVVTDLWENNKNIFAPGVEGTFYIGITGKIIYHSDSTIKSNYGYILASGIHKDTFEDRIVVKMLTKDGIDSYYLSDKAETDYIEKVSNEEGILEWNSGVEIEDKRFVKYKINTKGYISSFELVENDKSVRNYSLSLYGEYNDDTEMLDGKLIDKNTVVFILGKDENDENDCYATDMNYFVDEGSYGGNVYIKDGYTEVVIITSSNSVYNSESGFAIVTGTSHMIDKDENEIFAVDYVQNEIEGTVYFETDYFENKDEVEESDFNLGTVFVFNANSNNYVNKCEIIAKVNEDHIFTDKYDVPISASIIDGPSKDVEIVFGTLDSRKIISKGDLVTISDNSYIITSKANKYTYYNERNKDKIGTDSFLSGNAYYGNGTPVILKLVKGAVVDIYTISPNI